MAAVARKLDETHDDVKCPSQPLQSLTQHQHIGQLFTLARGDLNLSIKAVAERIHVRTLYLESIEKGEFDKLPSALYAAGFIRLYARFLKLDAHEILRRLDLARENPLSHSALIHTTAYVEPNRTVIKLSLSLSVLSLILMAYVFWESSPMETDSSSSLDVITTLPINEVPISLSKDTTQTDIEPKGASEALLERKPEDDPLSSESKLDLTPDPLLDDRVKQPSTEGMGPKNLIFKAYGDCWLELRREQHILFSGVLKTGQTYALDTFEGVILSVGNAPALSISLPDRSLDPLSKTQRVIKNIKLDDYVRG